MLPVKAVIFDLDDTLYLERDYVLSGFQAVACWAETNLDIPAEAGFAELKSLFERGQRGRTFNEWLLSFGHQDELVPQLVDIYRQHQPTLQPLAETHAVFATLRPLYRFGLISDGYLEVQQRKLAALQLAPFLDVIVFSDELGRDCWKPSVKPFHAALNALNLVGSEAVYVGDNPTKDFLGAKSAGMLTVRVQHASGIYANLTPPTPEHEPHVTISSLTELPSLLRNE
jgi:putative hydrolase of the HAD superfamily